MSENCTWTRLRARCTYDTDISYLTWLKWLFKKKNHIFCHDWCTQKLPSLPKICYCVLNARCFEYWDKICCFFFVLNWQLLFNIFGVQTHCLYKLLWLCIAYWMGCVDWIIKVVHFLYRRMLPLAFLFIICDTQLVLACLFLLDRKGTPWSFPLNKQTVYFVYVQCVCLLLAHCYYFHQQDSVGMMWAYTRHKQNGDPVIKTLLIVENSTGYL